MACLLLNRGKEAVMVANINLIKQESYSIVNLEKQLMSNESPKQTLLNDFSHRLKWKVRSNCAIVLTNLNSGCRVIINMTCLKIKKPHCGNAKYQKVQRWQ